MDQMTKKKKNGPAEGPAVVEDDQTMTDSPDSAKDEAPESVQYILPEEVTHEYLVDLIDQPAWKTILLDIVKAER
ncbi:MAG: hypothetical protein Q7R47_05625, partial [Candidatus Diapherotrites archaeon]|nr:hypothetical protein [Candidatus Diapherotrites archaeon]